MGQDSTNKNITAVNPEENLNDNAVLDALTLTKSQCRQGIVKAVFFTLIAVFIFFVPVTFRGSTDVTFGIIYKNLKEICGLVGLWSEVSLSLEMGF